MIAAISTIVAIATKKLSDLYDYKFPDDRYDRYGIKKARKDLEQTATYCILVYFSLQRLESSFHMIATIATIVDIELRSISAIVVFNHYVHKVCQKKAFEKMWR